MSVEQIDPVDESWALSLLEEVEQSDTKQAEINHSDQEAIYVNEIDESIKREIEARPSAIELQMMEYCERNASSNGVAVAIPSNKTSLLTRLISWFRH